MHHTPKHGSWLNIAEIGINIMTHECLDRRIPSIEDLARELRYWNDEYDKDPSPVNWQFKAKNSRIKSKSRYPDIDKNRRERDERQAAKLQCQLSAWCLSDYQTGTNMNRNYFKNE